MKLEHLDQDFVAAVGELEDARRAVARCNRELAERELSARVLRLAIEDRLRAGVKNDAGEWVTVPLTSKAECEKLAKADPEYLTHERATIALAHTRDIELAKAEGLALELRATIAADLVSAT